MYTQKKCLQKLTTIMVKWAQPIELAICPIYVRVTIKNSYVTIKWVKWAQTIDCSEITIFKVIQPTNFITTLTL